MDTPTPPQADAKVSSDAPEVPVAMDTSSVDAPSKVPEVANAPSNPPMPAGEKKNPPEVAAEEKKAPEVVEPADKPAGKNSEVADAAVNPPTAKPSTDTMVDDGDEEEMEVGEIRLAVSKDPKVSGVEEEKPPAEATEQKEDKMAVDTIAPKVVEKADALAEAAKDSEPPAKAPSKVPSEAPTQVDPPEKATATDSPPADSTDGTRKKIAEEYTRGFAEEQERYFKEQEKADKMEGKRLALETEVCHLEHKIDDKEKDLKDLREQEEALTQAGEKEAARRKRQLEALKADAKQESDALERAIKEKKEEVAHLTTIIDRARGELLLLGLSTRHLSINVEAAKTQVQALSAERRRLHNEVNRARQLVEDLAEGAKAQVVKLLETDVAESTKKVLANVPYDERTSALADEGYFADSTWWRGNTLGDFIKVMDEACLQSAENARRMSRVPGPPKTPLTPTFDDVADQLQADVTGNPSHAARLMARTRPHGGVLPEHCSQCTGAGGMVESTSSIATENVSERLQSATKMVMASKVSSHLPIQTPALTTILPQPAKPSNVPAKPPKLAPKISGTSTRQGSDQPANPPSQPAKPPSKTPSKPPKTPGISPSAPRIAAVPKSAASSGGGSGKAKKRSSRSRNTPRLKIIGPKEVSKAEAKRLAEERDEMQLANLPDADESLWLDGFGESEDDDATSDYEESSPMSKTPKTPRRAKRTRLAGSKPTVARSLDAKAKRQRRQITEGDTEDTAIDLGLSGEEESKTPEGDASISFTGMELYPDSDRRPTIPLSADQAKRIAEATDVQLADTAFRMPFFPHEYQDQRVVEAESLAGESGRRFYFARMTRETGQRLEATHKQARALMRQMQLQWKTLPELTYERLVRRLKSMSRVQGLPLTGEYIPCPACLKIVPNDYALTKHLRRSIEEPTYDGGCLRADYAPKSKPLFIMTRPPKGFERLVAPSAVSALKTTGVIMKPPSADAQASQPAKAPSQVPNQLAGSSQGAKDVPEAAEGDAKGPSSQQ